MTIKNTKIVRTICFFTRHPAEKLPVIDSLKKRVKALGYLVQTTRLCVPSIEEAIKLQRLSTDHLLAVGSLPLDEIRANFETLTQSDISFNLDLTGQIITSEAVDVLFQLIKQAPAQTFSFAYVFNNRPSSPFFPSATYEREGFSIGLQSTNLADGATTQDEWLAAMGESWQELVAAFADDSEFLGIDGSVAPLNDGTSSYVALVNQLSGDFSRSVTTDFHLKVTNHLKTQNPQPIGLCGLMFPCLEDDLLAKEYEAGNFSIERNVFLSLHSGLGIDTYPIGVNESPGRVLEILQLVQGLAAKYDKPLSVRLVSDGKAKIGEQTDFQNQYLEDVKLLAL